MPKARVFSNYCLLDSFLYFLLILSWSEAEKTCLLKRLVLYHDNGLGSLFSAIIETRHLDSFVNSMSIIHSDFTLSHLIIFCPTLFHCSISFFLILCILLFITFLGAIFLSFCASLSNPLPLLWLPSFFASLFSAVSGL